MACDPQLYIVDTGDTTANGKQSTHTVTWQTIGYQSNTTRKTAIQAHPAYLPSVTADGFVLDVLEWQYQNQIGDKKLVNITYRHQESSTQKHQNTPLQDVGDEETQISFSSIDVPELYYLEGTAFKLGDDAPPAKGFIDYDEGRSVINGTSRRKVLTQLNITKIYDNATITDPWLIAREDKMFTTNNATFRGRPANTVMFVGMTLRQASRVKVDGTAQEGPWHVTFSFDSMKSEIVDITRFGITDATQTQIEIFPFQPTWVYYRGDAEDTTSKEKVAEAVGFYWGDIYKESDFSTIIE